MEWKGGLPAEEFIDQILDALSHEMFDLEMAKDVHTLLAR